MKLSNLILLGLVLSGTAFATPKVELAGDCLANVENAIDETKEDDTGCVDGASVEEVVSESGNVIQVSYGRHVCEGYINGTAEVTLKNVERKATARKVKLTSCEVSKVEILEESGD